MVVGAELGLVVEVVVVAPGSFQIRPRSDEVSHVGSSIMLKIKPTSPHAYACFSPYLAFLFFPFLTFLN